MIRRSELGDGNWFSSYTCYYKVTRERTYKALVKDFKTPPSKVYGAVNKLWFIVYKFNGVIYDNGVVQQSGISKGKFQDIIYLKAVAKLLSGKLLLGHRAYHPNPLQMDRPFR